MSDHVLQEGREDGLAYCSRCRGAEIELQESCASRLATQLAIAVKERDVARGEVAKLTEVDFRNAAIIDKLQGELVDLKEIPR